MSANGWTAISAYSGAARGKIRRWRAYLWAIMAWRDYLRKSKQIAKSATTIAAKAKNSVVP